MITPIFTEPYALTLESTGCGSCALFVLGMVYVNKNVNNILITFYLKYVISNKVKGGEICLQRQIQETSGIKGSGRR
jgi:hypothetical protein